MTRRGLLLSLLLVAAEMGGAAAAVWSLAGVPRAAGNLALGIAAGGLAAVLAVYGLLTARFLTALRDAREITQSSTPQEAYAALHSLRRSVAVQAGLRLLLALSATATVASLLIPFGVADPSALLALVVTVTISVALVEVWRPVALGGLLRPLATRVDPAQGGARWRRETLGWDLTWAGLCTGAAGLVSVVVFVHFFIPLDPPQRQATISFFPVTVVLLTGAWLLLLRRLLRPVRRYLEDLAKAGGRPVAMGVAVQAFRAVQILPYTLAASKVLAFTLAGILLYLEGVWLFGIDGSSALLMMGATLLAALAAALYEAFWHRATLRAVLADLAAQHRLDVQEVRSPLSLRVKMFAGFGLVLFMACAVSIFWSFVQVQKLAVSFVQKQSKLKAEGVLERLRTEDKIRGPLRPADVSGLLGQLAGAGEEIYWYLPPTGAPERFASPGSDTPGLPFLARTRMRRLEQGVLRHPDLDLVGAFLRMRLGGRDLGSLAVLYPDQQRAANLPGSGASVLGIFFLVLFLLCAGIVVLIAADLSAPLRDLEKRAGEMARGDLQRPVVTGAEADEVGRLAFALDAMRRSLKDQIHAVENLNVRLEEKVTERTSALALANTDLQEALDGLTRAQDQLVRSEKLASIGQLVAGVAHELNNPINAVGNTIDPLDAVLRALAQRCEAGAPGCDTGTMLEDVQAMLRVIRNGTARIQRIVTSLSSFVRTDSEPTEAVDLNHLMEETLEIAGHLLADVTLKVDLSPLPPVPGDPGQLGQVLMNLVANAAQALSGAPLRNLRVSSRVAGDQVEVVVADSGPGVPDGLRSRIFDPFFTTKPVGQGTGLGLSISQEIVSRHGGTLELVDSPEGGAAFQVLLPAVLAASPLPAALPAPATPSTPAPDTLL